MSTVLETGRNRRLYGSTGGQGSPHEVHRKGHSHQAQGLYDHVGVFLEKHADGAGAVLSRCAGGRCPV